jgi:hypothetical protein
MSTISKITLKPVKSDSGGRVRRFTTFLSKNNLIREPYKKVKKAWIEDV